MSEQQKIPRTRPVLSALTMASVLYPGWLILTGGQAPLYGLSVVLAVAAGSLWLNPKTAGSIRHRSRLQALLHFSLFFLWHSLTGAIDVAWRAFHPRMPLQLSWIDYPLRLESDAARALFLGVVSVTPGTLGADLQAGVVRIHVIVAHAEPTLQELERRVAALFGQPLERHP